MPLAAPTTADRPARTLPELFAFWAPLWWSWLLMGLEGPLLQVVLVRAVTPEEQDVSLATWGAVFALQILIESPVIMLLATSTALARDQRSWRELRRFTVVLCLVSTLVAALCAVPPVWSVVADQLLRLTEGGVRAGQAGMAILVPWSAAIGWRRLHQGLLIRHGLSRRITIGTLIRLSTSLGMSGGLVGSGVHGLTAVAVGLLAGVVAEALYATLAARECVRGLEDDAGPGEPPLDFWRILRFHAPLAATSGLSLLVPPLLLAGIGRMPDPALHAAAWPVIFAVLFVFKAGSFALPETVIAQSRRAVDARLLRRFSVSIAGFSSLAYLGFVATPLAELWLSRIEELEESLVAPVRLGLWCCTLAIPLHVTLNLLRGVLVASGSTGRVYSAMVANLVTVTLVVGAGVALGARGVVAAAMAMTAAYTAECVVLLWRLRSLRSASTGSTGELL